MKNSCGIGPGRKCLECEFPPCNCQKCIKLRSEGKADQRNLTPRCKGGDTSNNTREGDKDPSLKPDSGSKSNNGTFAGFGNIPKFSFTPSNLSSMLFDIVGIIAFFMMATFMFWITTCNYLWRFFIFIHQSGRKTHIAAIVFFALLVGCTLFHCMQGRRMQASRRQSSAQVKNETTTSTSKQGKGPSLGTPSSPSSKKKCSQPNLPSTNKKNNTEISGKLNKNVNLSNNNNKTKSPPCSKCGRAKAPKKNNKPTTNLTKKSNTPSLCDLCANEKKACPNPVLSDEEIREMYKLSKLYAMPTEMKSPPPSLVHIVDYLSNYYFGTTGSTGNTLPPITT